MQAGSTFLRSDSLRAGETAPRRDGPGATGRVAAGGQARAGQGRISTKDLGDGRQHLAAPDERIKEKHTWKLALQSCRHIPGVTHAPAVPARRQFFVHPAAVLSALWCIERLHLRQTGERGQLRRQTGGGDDTESGVRKTTQQSIGQEYFVGIRWNQHECHSSVCTHLVHRSARPEGPCTGDGSVVLS
eukprot:3837969-Rhodomonas_salina.1